MTRVFLALAVTIAGSSAALAASVVNHDDQARTIIVTEAGGQFEIVVAPGQTIEFCPIGCFVTMPDGVRDTLTGSESVVITDGEGLVRW